MAMASTNEVLVVVASVVLPPSLVKAPLAAWE